MPRQHAKTLTKPLGSPAGTNSRPPPIAASRRSGPLVLPSSPAAQPEPAWIAGSGTSDVAFRPTTSTDESFETRRGKGLEGHQRTWDMPGHGTCLDQYLPRSGLLAPTHGILHRLCETANDVAVQPRPCNAAKNQRAGGRRRNPALFLPRLLVLLHRSRPPNPSDGKSNRPRGLLPSCSGPRLVACFGGDKVSPHGTILGLPSYSREW